MARYGGSWRIPTAATARSASMVSERSVAEARSDDLGGETRSRDQDQFYTADWRSNLRSKVFELDPWETDLRSRIQSIGDDPGRTFRHWDPGSRVGIGSGPSRRSDSRCTVGDDLDLRQARRLKSSIACYWTDRSQSNHISSSTSGLFYREVDKRNGGHQVFDKMPNRQVSNYNSSLKSPSLNLHDRQVFDEIPKRSQPHWDEEARMHATKELLKCIIDQRISVKSVESCVRDEVLHNCNQTEQWLMKKSQQQDSLPRRAEPVLWSYEIRKQTTSLETACRNLMAAVREVYVDDSDEADSSEEVEGVVHDVLEMQDEFNPILDGNEDTRDGELINDDPGDTIVTEFEKPSTYKNKVLATSLPASHGATIKELPLIQIASEGHVQGQLHHEGIDPSRELYNMPSNPEYYVDESIGASANKDKELEVYVMAQDPYVANNWAKALASADFILVSLSLTSTSKALNDKIFAKVKEGVMIVKNETRTGEFDVTVVNAPTIFAVKTIVEEDVSGGNTLVLTRWDQFSNKEANLTRKKMVLTFDPGGEIKNEGEFANIIDTWGTLAYAPSSPALPFDSSIAEEEIWVFDPGGGGVISENHLVNGSSDLEKVLAVIGCFQITKATVITILVDTSLESCSCHAQVSSTGDNTLRLSEVQPASLETDNKRPQRVNEVSYQIEGMPLSKPEFQAHSYLSNAQWGKPYVKDGSTSSLHHYFEVAGDHAIMNDSNMDWDGKSFSFGMNKHGPLGTGSIKNESFPQYGQLGHGTDNECNSKGSSVRLVYVPQPRPRAISAFSDKTVVKVSCGTNHTVAVDSSGFLYTWGYGGYGRLDHREQKDEWVPRLVEVFQRHNVLPHNAIISAGAVSSACTAGGGQLYMWGKLKIRGDDWMYPKPLMDLSGWNIHYMNSGYMHHVVGADDS